MHPFLEGGWGYAAAVEGGQTRISFIRRLRGGGDPQDSLQAFGFDVRWPVSPVRFAQIIYHVQGGVSAIPLLPFPSLLFPSSQDTSC